MRKTLGALALLASLGVSAPSQAALTSLTDLFVFGDSLSDGGNSGVVSGGTFPPPPYYNNQFSNGPVAVEQLWNLFNPGNTSFKPSLAGGTNYAIGGATTGVANSISNASSPPSASPYYNLGNAWQLDTFYGQLTAGRTFDPSTSLFVVWLFPNDVFNWSATGDLPGTATGTPGGPGDANALIGNGISNILTTVGSLASMGAKHFLVPNMPDLSTTPDGSGNAGLSALTIGFNTSLATYLDGFQSLNPSLDIVQFDTFAALNNLIAGAPGNGFTNTTESCVANLASGACNPDTWVFWDGLHPTTKVDSILAAQFYAAVVPEPETYALMLVGLIALAFVSRRRSAQA